MCDLQDIDLIPRTLFVLSLVNIVGYSVDLLSANASSVTFQDSTEVWCSAHLQALQR